MKIAEGYKPGHLVLISALMLVGCGREAEAPPSAPPPSARPQVVAQISDFRAREPVFEVEETPSTSDLPLYELKMDLNDLLSLEQNPFSNDTRPATFISGGQAYDVRVRVRGAFSRSWPKKSLKIIFAQGKPFGDHHSINLNSGWHDPAFVREALAYRIYAACDAVAPSSQMVRLNVNGHFHGLYVEVEQPDKGLLKRYNLKGASVYKATSRSNRADERDLGNETAYQGHYNKETQKDTGYRDLQQFCHNLQQTQDVLAFFNQNVDVEKYINYLVATVLTQNWDGFDKNHFIVYDREGSHKWLIVPWDLDRTFGDHWNWSFNEARLPVLLGTRALPGVTGWNRLEERFFSEPTLRARFLDRLAELLDREFTEQKLFPILDKWESTVAPDAARDRRRWPGPGSNFHHAIQGIRTFIQERRAYLQDEIKSLRSTG